MSSAALFVHVPVDEIEIVNGPGPMWLVQVVADLYLRLQAPHATGTVYVAMEFSLRTGASASTFRRKLKVIAIDLGGEQGREIFGGLDRKCPFTARFDGHHVSGHYNPKLRTGQFSLD